MTAIDRVEQDADYLPSRVAPEWTLALDRENPPRAMYPLGIDPATQELERQLFAGITSQTPHVVYYAFYAWALTRFRERHQGARMARGTFRRAEKRWLARLETVLRAATLDRNQDVRGLFGALGARRDGPMADRGRLALPDDGPYRTTGVNFYIGPLTDLAYAGRQEGARGEFRAARGAKVLADAMDDAIRDTRGGSGALSRVSRIAENQSKTIDVGDVRILGHALAIQPVLRTSPLHEPLIHLLFANGGPAPAGRGDSGWARSAALAFCLDVARQAGGAVQGRPIEIVRRAILTRHLDRDHVYEVPDAYRTTLAALQRLYERHFLQLALYGFWREVVVALQQVPRGVLPIRRLADVIANELADPAGVREVTSWLGDNPLGTPMDEVLRRAARTRHRRTTRRPWLAGGERLALAVADGRSYSAPSTAASAFALLVQVAEGWKHRTRDGRRVRFSSWHAVGARDRLSLNTICADLTHRGAMTGGDYLRWVLDAYIVGQSMRATVAKGPQSRSGEYVYFIVPDGGGYRLNQPPRLGTYLQIDSPRLRVGLSMLEELELVASTPTFRLTREGRRLLDDLRSVHAEPDESERSGTQMIALT